MHWAIFITAKSTHIHASEGASVHGVREPPVFDNEYIIRSVFPRSWRKREKVEEEQRRTGEKT